MFNEISTKEFWISPYKLAILGVILMFVLNNAPITFIIIGCFYSLISKKLIDLKSLIKFGISFALIQMLINIMFVLVTEFDYFIFAPWIYFRRILGYFIISLVLGSIIFFIVNSIIYGINLLIKKIKTNNNKEGENT